MTKNSGRSLEGEQKLGKPLFDEIAKVQALPSLTMPLGQCDHFAKVVHAVDIVLLSSIPGGEPQLTDRADTAATGTVGDITFCLDHVCSNLVGWLVVFDHFWFRFCLVIFGELYLFLIGFTHYWSALVAYSHI